MTEISAVPEDPVAICEGARLSKLAGPHTVRDMPTGQLAALAQDIRTFLIEKVCASGGHLGPNLGVVELTIALHRVFNSPHDAILFDTGHQAYVHKILTGRASAFGRLRQAGACPGTPHEPSRHTTGSTVPTPPHPSPMLTAWPRPTSCAGAMTVAW